jgi:hypothetical protein
MPKVWLLVYEAVDSYGEHTLGGDPATVKAATISS